MHVQPRLISCCIVSPNIFLLSCNLQVDQMMKRNCNLQLRLQPASAAMEDMFSGDSGDVHVHRHLQPEQQMYAANGSDSGKTVDDNHRHPQQQLTIFYNGRICTCDVTELQAKAIILVASREMEEERMKEEASTATHHESQSPISTRLQSQLHGSTTGLSMKKSLQRFLQKRKLRIQNASPYN